LTGGEPKDLFVGLEDLEHAHAQGVFDSIDRAMLKFGCADWKEKLVGVGCDGANVNLGSNDSVATRMSQNRPYVLPIHCVAHRLELGVLSALKNNPTLNTIYDILKKVYKHYHYSPKALRELRSIAEAMDAKILKPTRLQGTRWMPHLHQSIKCMLRSFDVILAHFEHVSQAGPGKATAEVKGRAHFVSHKIRDYRVLRYMFFMQDLLAIISTLSLRLQVNASTSVDFLDALETANLELVQLRQGPGPQLQSFLDELVLNGQNCKFRTTTLQYHNPNRDYSDMQTVVDTVQGHINGRLENPNDSTRRILQATRIFDLKEWPHNRQDLAGFGNADLQLLVNHFQEFLDNKQCQRNHIAHEWTWAKAHLGNRLTRQVASISMLFKGNADHFKNLLLLIEVVLVIPVSSAVCERGFSCVKRIKSDWRSRLTTEMMNHLLTVSIEGPVLEDYNAERAVQLWYSGGQRRRRPRFEAAHDDDDDDALLNFLLAHDPQDN
jgi:hypothetical protein